MMRTSDFDYTLPPESIAQHAIEPRDASRLLVIHRDSGTLEHRIFHDLPDYLRPGDVLVLNQTRVIPARLHATKIPGGGAVEILLIERIDDRHWLAMVGGKRVREGLRLTLIGEGTPPIEATVTEVRDESQRVLEFSEPLEPHLAILGEVPLPPYIHEPLTDPERYQTVYARQSGSVAAPTAGLHFTAELLLQIQAMGVEIVYCTLHVGPGTFQPVKTDDVASHHLHAEFAQLTPEDAKRINEAKLRGGRVIAVGTTTVRTLETAAKLSAGDAGTDVCAWRPVIAFSAQTDLFITPGYPFRVVDVMITNFHLPKSTLLMLVSAFASRDLMLHAYEVAVREGYRFYSLGDACLILSGGIPKQGAKGV
ncbi:MAG: tRNA preQ1(34) S-adenosylmethionine ribosyltransferase-isomerase QueA [Chloroflexota bacterium]